MADQQIRFEDGAAYERMMGTWSRIVGTEFLDWLEPRRGQRWIDIGCGNGAFTELICDRYAPAEIHGIDPSQGQLEFARSRPCGKVVEFHQGNAMALPFADNRFDAATMALVIFFIPDPARAVAEMARVVKPGGMVATYAWDVIAGGLPLEPIQAEMRAMGISPTWPPSVDASRMDVMGELWSDAGLSDVRQKRFTVQRTFASYEDFWSISTNSSIGPALSQMSSQEVEQLKAGVRGRVTTSPSGSVTCEAFANAIAGSVPG